MREWFTSNELLGLDGMPNSLTGVAQKARRNNWLSRKAAGKGRSFEYHISAFHPDIKKQLIEKYVTDKKEAEELLNMPAPVAFTGLDISYEQAVLLLKVLEGDTNNVVLIDDPELNLHPDMKQLFQKDKKRTLAWLQSLIGNNENRKRFIAPPSNVTPISNVKEIKTVPKNDEMCAVPVYNVYASCGFGAQNDAEYQLRTEFLPCLWLKRFGLTEETARIIICHGDSMEDTLSDGDEVLVDTRELEHPVKHGVYVVRIGKHVYIKRLKYDIMAEGYEVISDNKEEYKPFIVNEDKLNEFAVIGKVVTTVMKTVV